MAGSHLLDIARAWFDADRVARVFEPLIADWAQEHATLRGPARIRSWLRVHACFATTFAFSLPWQLKQRLPDRVTLSGWMAAELFAAIGVIAQMYVFFGAGQPGANYAIPAALGVALPLALLPAAVIVSRLGRPVEARTMVLRLALIAMVLLVPFLCWINPVANQAYREARRPAHDVVLRGDRELTISDLLSTVPPSDVFPEYARRWNDVRRDAALERASVLLMPLTMGLLGLAVARLSRRWSSVNAVLSWLAAGFLWLVVLEIGWATSHALLLAIAVMFHWHTRRHGAAVAERLA